MNKSDGTTKRKKGRARKGTGSLFLRPGSRFWQWELKVAGSSPKRRSTGTENHQEAQRIAGKWNAEFGIELEQKSTITNFLTVADILQEYLANMKRANQPSAYVTECMIRSRLIPFFTNEDGTIRLANSITSDDITRYHDERIESGIAKRGKPLAITTVKAELVTLIAAYTQAAELKPPKVLETDIPRLPLFMRKSPNNARSGFLEVDGYETLLEELLPSLKALFVIAYHTGMRKGKLTDMTWDQISFARKKIILDPNTTNGNKPTASELPFFGDMEKWLRYQYTYRNKNFKDCPYVFFWRYEDREFCRKMVPGTETKLFGKSWKDAVKRARARNPYGFENSPTNLLFHDLRRSAVRNMIQEYDIGPKDAMAWSGHKTLAMIDRYNISSIKNQERDAAKASIKFDELKTKARVAKKKFGIVKVENIERTGTE